MEPYQEAAEATKRAPLYNSAKNVAAGAAGAVGFRAANALISKIAPLLSSFVPESFAKKAIGKIDPRLGEFLSEAESAGATFDEAKEYISQKIQKPEESEPAKQNVNIIEQVDPKLYQFIDQEIRKGRKPIEAAAIAQNLVGYRNSIKKLEESHKTPWSQIIQSIFGTGETAQPNPQQQQPGQPKQGGQPGPGSQKLMDIMNQINQKLGQ